VRAETLARLRADVMGPIIAAREESLRSDPAAIRRAQVHRLRAEVDHPEMFERAWRVREWREILTARRDRVFALTASGDLTVDLRQHWRRLAAVGDPVAGALLASAVRRDSCRA
jgi:hypothetical protein